MCLIDEHGTVKNYYKNPIPTDFHATKTITTVTKIRYQHSGTKYRTKNIKAYVLRIPIAAKQQFAPKQKIVHTLQHIAKKPDRKHSFAKTTL